MEEEGAIKLWERSESRKLRYTVFIGDGDCSSYNTLCAMNDSNGIYGEGIPVRKEECVNHFHKRMGTAIRKIS